MQTVFIDKFDLSDIKVWQGDFIFNDCGIESLKSLPRRIKGDLIGINNRLAGFEDFPNVEGDVHLMSKHINIKLKDLEFLRNVEFKRLFISNVTASIFNMVEDHTLTSGGQELPYFMYDTTRVFFKIDEETRNPYIDREMLNLILENKF